MSVRHNSPYDLCSRRLGPTWLQNTSGGPLSHPGWARLVSGGLEVFYSRLFGPRPLCGPSPCRTTERNMPQLQNTKTSDFPQPANSKLSPLLLTIGIVSSEFPRILVDKIVFNITLSVKQGYFCDLRTVHGPSWTKLMCSKFPELSLLFCCQL